MKPQNESQRMRVVNPIFKNIKYTVEEDNQYAREGKKCFIFENKELNIVGVGSTADGALKDFKESLEDKIDTLFSADDSDLSEKAKVAKKKLTDLYLDGIGFKQ